ncbi:MAG: hypothetical protein RRC34_04870 [Lentisphaeria bacterium]|nr:hypothetical protein [Lentisphaeria bacterium]
MIAVIAMCFTTLTTATAPATIVHSVAQSAAGTSKTWEHRIAEAGNYQIGQAWVHILKGDKLRVEISVNDKLVKTHGFERGRKVEPYDAPLFRFQLRLENLKSGDRIRVACIPEGQTQYELAYKLAFGTPTFDGMKVFTLKQFGAKADGKHNDLPALWKTTAAAIEAGGGIIRFEKDKDYRLKLENPEDFEKKQFVFQLKGNKNIKFEGNGARLIIHPEKLSFIRLEDCENIQIDDFTQTFDPQPYYQGKVLKIVPDKLYADLDVPKRYPLPMVGKARQELFFARSLSDPLDKPVPGYISCQHLYIERTESDPDNPYRVRVHFRDNMEARLKAAKRDGAEGNDMIMPHQLYGHYTGGHVDITRSGRISLTKLWIQSMANMGIIPAHNWGPVTFSQVDVRTPNPETERFVSWRDGFHVRDNRMGILIEDGHYDGGLMYDDLFSPHSMLNKVEAVKELPGGRMDVTLYGLSPMHMFQPGDWVSAWDPKQVETGKGIARIIQPVEGSETRGTGANFRFRVVLDRDVDLQLGDYLFHEETINWDMVIRRCTNSRLGKHASNRWRTPVKIEDCTFRNMSFHIYAGDGMTIERPRPRHIVIDKSVIEERIDFTGFDAWDVKISKTLFEGPAMIIFRNTDLATFEDVQWKDGPETIIMATDGTTITFKGENTRNGKADLKNRITLDKDCQVHFSE